MAGSAAIGGAPPRDPAGGGEDEAEALPVDVIDSRFVSERLAPISTIRLEDVEVTPLPAAPAAEATPGS